MANVIRSIGYSLGKIHSGMICYLCHLCREGDREPLESFLGSLGIRMTFNPMPRREWNNVDLAILDEDTGHPRILVETKVDDHEAGTSDSTYQTVRYAKTWPSCDAYLFFTLGMGEYYHAPRSHRFTWVRIREFLRAVDAIESPDDIVIQWKEEIRREVGLQEAVLRADRTRLSDYRAGSWNIYLLGQLVKELVSDFQADSLDIEPTCYTHGTRPDTILNFGWSQDPLYMEINYNGRVNLKISLEGSESVRKAAVEQAIRACQTLPFDTHPVYHRSGKIGDSKTIASFNIGLINEGGVLRYTSSVEETRRRLIDILRVFYGRKGTLPELNEAIQPTGSAPA